MFWALGNAANPVLSRPERVDFTAIFGLALLFGRA